MVHVTTPRPSLGAAIGEGLGQGLEQLSQRSILNRELEGLKNLGPNAAPSEILSKLVRAANISPEIGKNLGSLYQAYQGEQNRRNAANIPLTSGGISSQGRDITQNAPIQRQQQPMQRGGIGAQGRPLTSQQAERFFPTNIGQNEAPGNAPQEATGGIARPVLSGTEVLENAQNIARQWQQAGVTDRGINEALNIVNSENESNKAYNQTLENERQRRVQEQQRYGTLAEEELKSVYPEATNEQLAYFAKKGEEQSAEGKSEADTRRFLAKEATKFKNMISNIENSLSAPRIQNKLQKTLAGNQKTLDQAIEDASIQVRPLVEAGLVDTARNLLGEIGLYPEEREKAVFREMNQDIRKQIKDVPKPIIEKKVTASSPRFGVESYERSYAPESKENLKDNILSVWGPEENKNINMLQMRKEYEDLGYDWRIFKDSLNDLFKDGQIKLTDDQFNQFNSHLDEPPMTLLDKILYKLNIIGR
jgi:hypothetical protein